MRTLYVALAIAGCGSPADSETTAATGGGGQPPAACAPGERLLADGRCMSAGVRDDGCPAGSRASDAGCIEAGIPPESCAEGFESDGAWGCRPILPRAACNPGELAVPGDRSCHAIAACAAGTWGDIVIEGDTQHVDDSYSGGSSDGSATDPWTSIQAAVDAANPGAIVAVAAGNYSEPLVITKPVRLWGVCPSDVAIASTVVVDADGTEVHRVALTGGLSIEGVAGALVDGVWVHDTSGRGIDVRASTAVVIANALVENTLDRGVYVEGGGARIERVAVRNTTPSVDSAGRGINVRDDTVDHSRADVTVVQSLVEASHEVGIMVHASDARIEGTVVQDTLPSAAGKFGRGINVQIDPSTGERGHADIIGCVVRRNREQGIYLGSSEALVETTVVSDTAASSQDIFGHGISVHPDPTGMFRSTLTVRQCLLEQNHEVAIFFGAGDGTVESTRVRETLPVGAGLGRALSVQADGATGATSSVALNTCIFERSRETAVLLEGSELTMEGTLVRDTLARDDGLAGRAITVQDNFELQRPADLSMQSSALERSVEAAVVGIASHIVIVGTAIRDTDASVIGQWGIGIATEPRTPTPQLGHLELIDSVVENSHVLGVLMQEFEGVISHSRISDTHPEVNSGLYGDGLAVQHIAAGTRVEVTGSLIATSARAGVANFGGAVSIASTTLDCNTIDLNGEDFEGALNQFDDLGNNVCGCGSEIHPCKTQSADLVAPEPPPF